MQIIDRSTKIASVLFVAGFLLHHSVLFAQTEIGLQLYTFRKQIPNDVPGMFQKISAMGIKELEGGGTYGMSVDSFKMLLKKNNLRMVSVGGDFKLLDSNPQVVLEKGKTFGGSYVT